MISGGRLTVPNKGVYLLCILYPVSYVLFCVCFCVSVLCFYLFSLLFVLFFVCLCVCVFHSMHLKLEKQSDVGFKECLLCVKHQETEAIVVRDSPPFCKVGI